MLFSFLHVVFSLSVFHFFLFSFVSTLRRKIGKELENKRLCNKAQKKKTSFQTHLEPFFSSFSFFFFENKSYIHFSLQKQKRVLFFSGFVFYFFCFFFWLILIVHFLICIYQCNINECCSKITKRMEFFSFMYFREQARFSRYFM